MNLKTYSTEDLSSAANAGNAEAKAELGRRFMYGADGVQQDPGIAKKWLEEAADAGNTDAIRRLGVLYLGEHGIPADYSRAVALLTDAADAGDLIAMFQLSNVYMQGTGVEEDPLKALELIRRSADLGFIEAQFTQGTILASGQLGKKDSSAAARYFEMVVSHESDEDLDDTDRLTIAMAYDSLADMYKEGDPYPVDMDRAVELYTKAAEGGYTSAQLTLGLLYQGSDGVTRDFDRSMYWLQMAALGGNELAITSLGAFGAMAEDRSPEEIATARSYLKMAADGGSSMAQSLLGTMFLQEGNTEEAIPLLEAAADQNDVTAQYNLAYHYILTVDTPESHAKGAVYAEKAAASGEKPDAKCLLALLYTKATCYEADPKKMLELIREAREEGSELASSEEFVRIAENLGAAFKTRRQDFLRMEDASGDVETLLSLVRAEDGPCRNPAADALIKNALTYEKLGNREKLLEACVSVTETYPDDVRGWILYLLAKSGNLNPFFLPAHAEIHYDLYQTMVYVLRLAEDAEELKQTAGAIFLRYQNNCQAKTNETYLQLAEEMKEIGKFTNETYDALVTKHGLEKQYPEDLREKHPNLTQAIPITTDGLYGLAHYVLRYGLGIYLTAQKMIQELKEKEKTEKARLRAQTLERFRQAGGHDERLMEEKFEEIYEKEAGAEIRAQWKETVATVNEQCNISPSADTPQTACIEALRAFAGTDDAFIEMLIAVCEKNDIPGYEFLEEFFSKKVRNAREETRRKEEETGQAAREAERAAREAERAAREATAAAERAKIAPADTPKSKWLTMLSYLGILFLIPAFLDKESKSTAFHVNQGGTLFAVNLVRIVLLDWILGGWFFGLISSAVSIAILVLSIMGIVNVFQNVQKELPVIGKLTFVDKLLGLIRK